MIVCLGDSLTYGHDDAGGLPPLHGSRVPRSVTPYPEALAVRLDTPVSNLGYPGDTAARGLLRWPTLPPGQVVLMYGTNEALRSSALTFPLYASQYRRAMRSWLSRCPAALVLEPPPLAAGAADQRLFRLSIAARLLAGPRWVPTRPHLTGDLWTDGVHLTPAACRQLAGIVAARLM